MSILKGYFIYITFIILIYTLGQFLNIFFKEKYENNTYKNIFSNFYLGTFLLVILFALYQTSFRTIFVLVPILLMVYLILFQKRNQYNIEFNFKELIHKIALKKLFLLVSIFTLFYFFQYYILFGNFTGEIPKYIPNADYISYARISEYLVLTGKENIWQVHNLILDDYHGTTPYHYFNEWIVAFLIKTTNQKSIFLQEIILNSFLLGLIVLGFLSLMEHFNNNIRIVDIVVCVLFIFFKFILTIQFLTNIEYFSVNSFSIPKISILYIMLIFSFLFFLQKKQIEGSFNLLLIPIAYFTATPAILMSTVILGVLGIINKKKKAIRSFLLPFLLFGLIICFYQLTGNTLKSVHHEFTDVAKYLKIGINIMGGTFLQVLILSIPFILFLGLLIYLKKITFKKYILDLSPILVPSFIIVASAGVSWALFNPLIDSVQLFHNIGITTLNIVFIICFLHILSVENKKIWGYIMTFMILSLCLFQTNFKKYSKQFYSEQYLNNIQYYFKKDSLNPIGASLFGEEDYKAENSSYYINHKFSANTNVSVLGANLKYIANNFNTICLSVHDIPNKNDKFVTKMIDISCFNKYSQKINSKNIVETRKKFIKDYKINYIVASKFANIDFLRENIKTIIVDENTQEKFIILKAQ